MAGAEKNATALGIVAPEAEALEPMIGPLVTALARDEYPVVGFGAAPGDDARMFLEENRVKWVNMPLSASGFEPTAQIRGLATLSRAVKSNDVRALLGLGLSGAVLAGLAGRMTRVHRTVALFDALPPELSHATTFASRFRQKTARRLMNIALNRVDAAIFQNESDAEFLRDLNCLPDRLEVHISGRSLVNLDDIPQRPLPTAATGLTFLAIGPLVRSQGIREYCLAALSMMEQGIRANWNLLASEGRGPDAIDPAELPGLGEAVTLLAPATPIGEALADTHVFVLPALTDATPEAAVHALGTGRAMIVTDRPAHTALVDEPVNGLIVQSDDHDALAEGMSYYVTRPDVIAAMARASRMKAERMFGAREATKALRRILDLVPPQRPAVTRYQERQAG